MKKMKRFLAVLLSFCCFVLTGCLDKVFYNGYTEEEVGIINAKFDSFQNSKNFAIQDSHVIALIDKSVTIGTDKLYCNGKKINENTSHLIGCGEQYFYVSDSVMTGFRTIRLHVMQVDYNTLEMKEIMQIENSSRFPYSFCKDGKIYIRNEERYCICDIASGEKQWVNSTSFDEFNEMRKESKYSFDIEEKKQVELGKALCTAIISAFCSEVEKAGYFTGIYSFDSFFATNIDKAVADKYTCWIARIGGAPNHKHDMWQYSWKERINGIKGDVDVNHCYKDFPRIIRNAGLNGYGYIPTYNVNAIVNGIDKAKADKIAEECSKMGMTVVVKEILT